MAVMRITLNGEPCEIDDGSTIARLLEQHPPDHRAYAVEVNRQVVPRAQHKSHELRAGDSVEIVTLVGGG